MENQKTIDNIVSIINKWVTEKRTGSIRINFYDGGIANASETTEHGFEVIEERHFKFNKK